MKEGKRESIFKGTVILGLALLLMAVPISFTITGKKEYSDSERRYLKEFPTLTGGTIMSGSFMEEFEEFTLDHFPFRDKLRGLKTFFSTYIFKNKDNNGIYRYKGYLAKMEYPLREEQVEYAVGKIEDIYNRYLKESGSKCYVAVIPDKNYYMAPLSGRLSMDYEKLFSLVKEKTASMEYLDLTKQLTLEDYYKTDTHWRQERIIKAASYLGKEMGVEIESEYKENILNKEFYGVYAGQWAMKQEGENLIYLTNDILDKAEVTVMDSGRPQKGQLYDYKKASGKDAYELFLSGTRAVLVLENKGVTSGKELILFRDSFGSSLAPLLLSGYKKIIMVDIRYVQSNILEQFVEFKGQDVLFLYSTLILNSGKAFR